MINIITEVHRHSRNALWFYDYPGIKLTDDEINNSVNIVRLMFLFWKSCKRKMRVFGSVFQPRRRKSDHHIILCMLLIP